MCVGIPMRIASRSGDTARCEADGRCETVDLSLVPDAQPGDHVLVFLGAARQMLEAEEARLIAEALAAVSALLAGTADAGRLEAAFADLDREPQLPPHLAAAHRAGLKEA